MSIHQENIKTIMAQTNNTDQQHVRQLYFANNKDVTKTIMELLGITSVPSKAPTTSIERTEEQKELDKMRKILDTKDTFMENLKNYIK